MKIPLIVNSSKCIIAYRFLGVVFSLIAVLSALAALLFAYNQFYGRFLMYGSYAAINALLATGFWNMKKYLVSLLGMAFAAVSLIDMMRMLRGTLDVKSALIGLGITGFLFGATYLSRDFLAGEYKNYKMIGVFVGLLVLAQIAITFLK